MALRASFPLTNKAQAKLGPRGLPIDFVFAGAVAQDFNFELEQNQVVLDFVQSVYINNLANALAFDLTFGQLGFAIRCRANQQGIFPVIVGAGACRGTALLAGAGTVKCIFTNTEYNYATWAV